MKSLRLVALTAKELARGCDLRVIPLLYLIIPRSALLLLLLSLLLVLEGWHTSTTIPGSSEFNNINVELLCFASLIIDQQQQCL
jgi:hypothetical protein